VAGAPGYYALMSRRSSKSRMAAQPNPAARGGKPVSPQVPAGNALARPEARWTRFQRYVWDKRR